MRKTPLLLLCVLSIFQKTVQSQNAHQPEFFQKSAFRPTATLADILQKSIKNWLPIAQNWEDQAIEQTPTQAKNLIVITTDGLRWQEIFEGAAGRTREELMPFFWKKLAAAGQVYGNRNHGSKVRVSNRTQISYPGYSELICGFADDERVLLNTRKSNPNRHVFEWLNRQRGFRGRVSVFGSWDLFPYIFNEKRAKIEVNAAFEKIEKPRSAAQNKLNQQLETVQKHWKNHLRPDTLTWAFAKNQMKAKHPRAVFIGLEKPTNLPTRAILKATSKPFLASIRCFARSGILSKATQNIEAKPPSSSPPTTGAGAKTGGRITR